MDNNRWRSNSVKCRRVERLPGRGRQRDDRLTKRVMQSITDIRKHKDRGRCREINEERCIEAETESDTDRHTDTQRGRQGH